MKRFLRDLFSKPMVKFILIGGLNTVFSYCIFAFYLFLTKTTNLSIILATITSILFNFKTYGKFVFGSSNYSRIFRFIGAYSFLITIQILLLRWLNQLGVGNPYVAVAILLLPMALLSFGLMKKFVFHASLNVKTEVIHQENKP